MSVDPTRQQRLVAVALLTGTFLSALDSAIVGTAMPTVIASLGGTELYTWVFAAYMLAFTTATPLFGKLSDLIGQRILYAVAVGLFLAGSALCGASHSMVQLIAFRGLQGIGGGGLMTLGLTIIGHAFAPAERPRMQALVSAMWAIASLAGPAVGGLLTDHLSWRWVFHVNVPIGIVPAVLILSSLSDTRREGRASLDLAGAFSLAGAVLALLFALLWGPSDGWASGRVLALLVATIALGAVFARSERRAAEPVVPFELFRIRTFSVCSLENFLTGAALFGITGFIPLFAQGALGTSATAAGLAIMPLSLGWPLGSVAAGRLLERAGYRKLTVAGLALMIAGFALLSRMDLATSPTTVGLYMFVIGLGMGTLTPTVTVGVQNSVPRSHMGVASASVAFYRNIGGSIGVGVFGAVLHGRMQSAALAASRAAAVALPGSLARDPGDPQVLLRPELASTIPPALRAPLHAALASSLAGVFAVSMVTVVIGLVAAALWMPHGFRAAVVRPRVPGGAAAGGEG